jgi:hypothetical protein
VLVGAACTLRAGEQTEVVVRTFDAGAARHQGVARPRRRRSVANRRRWFHAFDAAARRAGARRPTLAVVAEPDPSPAARWR